MKKLALLVLLVPVGIHLACEDGGTPATDYASVLQAVSDMGKADTAAFASAADDHLAALKAFEAAPDATTLAKAQSTWRGARAAYRKLDALRMGPVTDLGIAERIDVTASAADIEAIVSGTATIDVTMVAAAPGARKGFLGAEYLLFSADGADAALKGLVGDGVPARRRSLARAIGEELAQSAHQLSDAWSGGAHPIGAEISGAGKTSTRYPTQRAAVDDLVAGIGNGIELVAGVRLGRTLGKNAGGAPDPTAEPARASDSAVADMAATLGEVSALYANTGFATRIKDRSAALDVRVTQQIQDCSMKVGGIPAPYANSLTSKTAIVDAAYEACKTLRQTWNVDLSSAVGATLKSSDSDGD